MFKPIVIVVLTFTSRPRSSNGRIPQYPFRTPLPSEIWIKKANENERNKTVASLDGKNFPIQSWKDEREKLIHPESRVLSLGTPLTSFGFTLYDLKNSLSRMSKVMTILRFLGIYKPPGASWGWDYFTSVFSRISTETHKFKAEDLSSWLSNQRKRMKKYKSSLSLKLRMHSQFMEWYLDRIFVGMPATNQHMGIWDSWISLSLQKATKYFQKVLILSSFVYIFISILIAWILSTTNEDIDDEIDYFDFFDQDIQQRRRGESIDEVGKRGHITLLDYMFKNLTKALKTASLILSILGFVHWRLESCILVQDIRSGMKLQYSFPKVSERIKNHTSVSLLPMAGVRRITHGRGKIEFVDPTRDDILIGTRFDSLYLRVVNRFLDYHTGNRAWRKRIREASVCTKRGGFFSTSNLVPNVIIDSILREMKGKLLLQTPESGKFTVMTNSESRTFTRRALILEQSLLLSELDRSISFMVSEMRFESTLRATSLALFGIGMLEGMRERIFGESDHYREFPPFNQKENRKILGSISKLFRSDHVLTPVKRYVPTLRPETLISLKNKGKRGGIKPQLSGTKKVVGTRKRRTMERADAQRIIQINKQKRKRK